MPTSEPGVKLEDAVPDADDATIERAQCTTALLLPDWPSSFADRFSLVVSKRAFDGYAAQPSPCCAAASVAGACNAALGCHASDGLTHLHVAALLHTMLVEQAAKKRATLLRLLGVASIQPALVALASELSRDGRSLGGRKEAGCTAKEALSRLAALSTANAPAQPEPENGGLEDRNVNAADAADAPSEAQAMWHALAGVLRSEQRLDDGAAQGDDDDDDEALIPSVRVGSKADDKVDDDGFARRVRKELKALIGKVAGCEQLAPEQTKLLTTHVGNWGIHGAVRALAEGRFDESDPRLTRLREEQQSQQQQQHAASTDGEPPSDKENGGAEQQQEPAFSACAHGSSEKRDPLPRYASLGVRTLASLRVAGTPAPPILLRSSDGEREVAASWAALKVAFAKEGSALIVHHKNHYSVLFAMREWRTDDGAAVMEVLTARKGQRPTAWIAWTELHRTLSSWAGYGIMQVSAG